VSRIPQTQDANDPSDLHRNPPAGRRIAWAAPTGASAWVCSWLTRRGPRRLSTFRLPILGLGCTAVRERRAIVMQAA
jgi:hypothetical protein